jgi:hypothetical protein
MEVNVERLKEPRRERVLSLRELEEKSGVSYNTIWRIEDDKQGAPPNGTEAGGSPRGSTLRTHHGELEMGKRGNGEGSISRRKHGLYMACYTVETATGAKRKTVYAKTRKEAAKKLTAAMAEASKGITADGGPKTVGAFLASWKTLCAAASARAPATGTNPFVGFT